MKVDKGFGRLKLSHENDREIYKFTQDGKMFYIIPSTWSTVSLPVNGSSAIIIDLIPDKSSEFTIQQIEPENGYAEIELKGDPVLVEIC